MFHVEQNLTNEIVALLLQTDIHPRSLAEKLQTNHMTVTRKLQVLVDENVVDYRAVGKTKVYGLKKSIEGRNAGMIGELYKQSQIIRRYPILRRIFKSVQETPGAPLALLFGSYAKGNADNKSDIDIYIETEDPTIKRALEKEHSALSVKIGGFDPESLLIREIIKDHVIIKGVELYFDKTGFLKETVQR